jgi:hypothetical protein
VGPTPHRRLAFAALACALACGEAEPAPRTYPEVAELPERPELPDPFTTFFEPRVITSADGWREVRRPELQDLFQHYVYGWRPEAPTVTATLETPSAELADGVVHTGVRLALGDAQVFLHVSVFRPAGAARPPVLLALNPCGNHTLTDAPQVKESEAWAARACPGRGGRAERWPIAQLVARGYALVTVHESDIDPDDPDDEHALDGVHPHFDPGAGVRTRWARIAAWSWGLSRVLDYIEQAPELDGARVLVTGHSRRGKAALLAAAFDPRFAAAAPHQSGLVGASPCRDAAGETVSVINAAFPSCFNDVFPEFEGREEDWATIMDFADLHLR